MLEVKNEEQREHIGYIVFCNTPVDRVDVAPKGVEMYDICNPEASVILDFDTMAEIVDYLREQNNK